jgi:hypothetical protein
MLGGMLGQCPEEDTGDERARDPCERGATRPMAWRPGTSNLAIAPTIRPMTHSQMMKVISSMPARIPASPSG